MSLPWSVAAQPHSPTPPLPVAASDDAAVTGMALLGVAACIAASWWWPLMLPGLALLASGVLLRRLELAAASTSGQPPLPEQKGLADAPAQAAPSWEQRHGRHAVPDRLSGPVTERMAPAATTLVTTLVSALEAGTTPQQVA